MPRVFFMLMGLWSAPLAPAGAVTNDFCAAGVAEFTAAYSSWDAARFGAAAECFGRAITNAPSGGTNHYWLGVAHFHRMLQLESGAGSATNKAASTASRDAAVVALETAVKLNPADAESHALLGTLYGMKIDGNLIRAARLGPRVAKHQKLALQHGAQNPRVQYLLGTCQFHTAKKTNEWRHALKTFQAAEKLFEKEAATPISPTEPRWGRSTCLTFLGRTHEKLGQGAEAAACFRKALALHPQDSAAQAGLKRAAQAK